MVLKSEPPKYPMQVSLYNSVIGPSFKILRDNFLTKWPRLSEVSLATWSKSCPSDFRKIV